MAEPIDLVGFLLAWSGPLVATEPNESGFFGYNRTHSSREVFLLMWKGLLAVRLYVLGCPCSIFLDLFRIMPVKKTTLNTFFFFLNIETPFLKLFCYTQIFNNKEWKLGWKEEKLSI